MSKEHNKNTWPSVDVSAHIVLYLHSKLSLHSTCYFRLLRSRERLLSNLIHTSTDLLSLLEGEELELQVVWELDMRDTNFWMVLRDGALIRELRRLWYFWNKLSTWTWTAQCELNLDLCFCQGIWVSFSPLKSASLFYLKVFEGLSPEQWVRRLQLEDSQHHKKDMDAESPSATAAGLSGNSYAYASPLQAKKTLINWSWSEPKSIRFNSYCYEKWSCTLLSFNTSLIH